MQETDARRIVHTSVGDALLVKERRAKLVATAAKIMSKKGYKATTTAEMAVACGISQGNLYNYLGSKQDVLRLILADFEQQVFHSFEEYCQCMEDCDPIDAIDAIEQVTRFACERLNDLHSHHQVLTNQMIHLPEVDQVHFLELTEKRIEALERIILRGIEKGVFYVDDARHAAITITYLFTIWVRRFLLLRSHYTQAEHITTLITEILRILGVREGRQLPAETSHASI